MPPPPTIHDSILGLDEMLARTRKNNFLEHRAQIFAADIRMRFSVRLGFPKRTVGLIFSIETPTTAALVGFPASVKHHVALALSLLC